MSELIYKDFLESQRREALELAESSDLLDVLPVGPEPYSRFLVHMGCKGLVRNGRDVADADYFELGIQFPPDYLRRAEPAEVLTFFGPKNVFHPNIRFPFICPGRLRPGTELVDLLYQCFEIITYQKVTMIEGHALNREACPWSRRNKERFPIDSRPLKRRRIDFKIEKDRPKRKTVES